jgi:hypothetical protein
MAETKIKQRNVHLTAESWLIAAVDALRPDFELAGKKIPESLHCDWGFDGHGSKKTEVSGQFWEGSASTDEIPKIIIRSVTDDVVTILDALVHQCVHACVGAQEGHGKGFRELALRIGLDPPMRTSKAGKRLRERLHAVAEGLGPFPNAKLNFDTHTAEGMQKVVADKPDKQESRQRKAECLIDACGYIVRASAQTLRRGAPLCPIHTKPMWHEELPPEPVEEPKATEEPELPVPEPVLATESKAAEAS